jgi:hypothetical protein
VSVRQTVLTLALALASGGCRAARSVAPPVVVGPRVHAAEFGSMRNVSRVGALWIGSYPSPSDLDLAARRGVDVLIDLSAPCERPTWDLAAACARLGLDRVDVGVASAKRIGDREVDRCLEALRSVGARQALLFCTNGDRAAMFLAIHRAADQGLPLEQALDEARRAGMKPGHSEAFVRAQAERLHRARRDPPQPDASSPIASATASH